MQVYSYSYLVSFCKNVFVKMGCSDQEASLATKVLLSADLRGIDSHGVARLSGYVNLWEANRVNAVPTLKVIHETQSTATLDADSALGLVAAPQAMNIAIEKANQVGSGWVSVCNSNHFGIAGYHAMMALEKNMIGIAMTNASPLVAPTNSLERLLGTNPIAVAIPAGNESPFVADFATTTAANGKLEILQRKNLSAPEGWIQDKEGNTSFDPHELKKGGALLSLGGEHASHKGYCLGAIVDIFSAVFSGANYGPWVPPFVSFLPLPENPVGKGIGHFIGAIRIDAFRPGEDFKKHMDNWIQRFRSAEAKLGEQVQIPGDIERKMQEERMQSGIPLLDLVIEDLKKVGEKMKVEWVK